MFSRRSLLKSTLYPALYLGLSGTAALRSLPAAALGGASALPLPTLDATGSNSFTLAATAGKTAFLPGVASPTLGFNRPYLGPVVRVRTGTEVAATVENRSEVPISVHWHGLLVTGDVDGGPHQAIPPGKTWQPVLPIRQPPATLWYHSHLHGQTAPRVYAGLAGVLIVDDGKDRERGLPATPAADDFVLVLQDKRFDATGVAVYQPGASDLMHGFIGDTILVNGQIQPQLRVPASVVRLRLVNAANGRNFDLHLADDRSLVLIATDQGYLSQPLALDRLRLTPGERAEVLIDFGEGRPTTLLSEPHQESRGVMEMGGMMHDMLPLAETFTAPFPVLDFTVDPSLPGVIREMPAQLDGAATTAAPTVATRNFTLNDMGMMMGGMMGGHGGHSGGMGFAINGRPFDMARLDLETRTGTTERWIIAGEMMGHPFHIHGVRFRVASENGGRPRAENSGWKDTVFVEGEAELLVEFAQAAAATAPFMMHCHILEHEDAGMMAQFAVAAA
jgi:FtsP/CotA-like multicopper oxidase with cupredoxin domain